MLVAGLIAALLAVAAAPAAGQSLPVPAPGCTVIDQTFPRVSPTDGTVVVPVIIHYMVLDLESVPSSEPFDPDGNHVAEVLKKIKQMNSLFGAPTPGAIRRRRNVNHVWAPFGVRLALARTERCDFTWADVGRVPVPAPTKTDLTLFRAIARRFNPEGFNGLNVYQWPKIDDGTTYGSTPRADGAFPGPGGVWFHVVPLSDTSMGKAPNPRSVVRLMAHEVGHFFSLKHNCTDSGERDLPECPFPGTSGKLMTVTADGIGLSDCEDRKARQGVTKILQGTPISTEEEMTCPVADQ